MIYIPEESKVIYQSKDGKDEKVFDALEWIAAMVSHPPALPEIHSHWTEMLDREIRQASARDRRQPWRAGVPNKGEQMVRYYGYYSNVSRGKRKKRDFLSPIFKRQHFVLSLDTKPCYVYPRDHLS